MESEGAKGILYNIVGDKNIQLSEVSYISKVVSDSINKNAKIIFGINQSQKETDKLRITLLATGCASKLFRGPDIMGLVNFPGKKIVRVQKKNNDEKKIKPEKEEKKTLKVENIKRKNPKSKTKPIKKNRKGKPGPVKKAVSKPKMVKNLNLSGKENYQDKTVRRTGLELKKAAEAEEKELLEKEKTWETPAILRNILRKKPQKNN